MIEKTLAIIELPQLALAFIPVLAVLFIEHRRENPVIFSRWDESMKLTLFLNIFSNCLRGSVANRANKITV